ncbi:MAG: outer membrane beta-barrel protein [Bdellovibrionia bacterium]
MKKLIFLSLLFFVPSAYSMQTEVGLSYGYKTTYFTEDNFEKSDSASANVSFYFWEKIALELSYTQQQIQREEKFGSDADIRRIYQNTQYYGGDLILILADKKSLLQPYIKGGAAYFLKEQTMKTGTNSTQVQPDESGTVPSYGVGLRVAISERLNIRFSYDVWNTDLAGIEKKDTFFKAGLTWVL